MPWIRIVNKKTGKESRIKYWEGPYTDEVAKMVDDAIRRPPVQVAVRKPRGSAASRRK